MALIFLSNSKTDYSVLTTEPLPGQDVIQVTTSDLATATVIEGARDVPVTSLFGMNDTINVGIIRKGGTRHAVPETGGVA
jgi:hypothetical protein